MTNLEKLRAKIADLKAGPIYLKAGLAEQVLDAVIAVLAEQDREINELKGEKKWRLKT